MSFNEQTLSGDQPRHLKIDTEHFSVRFLVPVLTIGLLLAVHIGGLALLHSVDDQGVSPLCIVLPADAIALFGGGYAIERALKRLLPSRRNATLTGDSLVITDARHKPPTAIRIAWDQTVNVTAWRFTVRRRTRVPKGWYCMALRLLQDEDDVILYTFMSQDEAEHAVGFDNFTRLRPRKETRSNTDLHAVADQRRLLKLEDTRWEDGAEIGRDDFHALLAVLQRRVPDWR